MNQAIPHPLLQNAEAFAPYGENQSDRIDLAEEAQALQQGQRVGIRGRQAHGAGQRNSASNGGKPGSEWCSHGWKRSLNAVGRLYFSCHIGTHFVTNL